MLLDTELEKVNASENVKSRPSWDEYYLAMSYVVAQRSFDPSSKCGCVLVSKDGRVLSTGYNGPLKGSIDEAIPLTRPTKYYHFLHGEENALLAYNGSYQDIQGSTAYVTGMPCHKCLRMLIQKGIKRIVIGCNHTALCTQNDEDAKAKEIMIYKWEDGLGLKYTVLPSECHVEGYKAIPRVEIKEIGVDMIKGVLNKTNAYIDFKNPPKG